MAEHLNIRLLPSGAHPQDGVPGEYADTLLYWLLSHTEVGRYADLLWEYFKLRFSIRYSYFTPHATEQYTKSTDYEEVYDFRTNMRIYQGSTRYIFSNAELIESPTMTAIHLASPRDSELRLISRFVCDMFKTLSGKTFVSCHHEIVDRFETPITRYECDIPTFSSPTELEMKLKLLKLNNLTTEKRI